MSYVSLDGGRTSPHVTKNDRPTIYEYAPLQVTPYNYNPKERDANASFNRSKLVDHLITTIGFDNFERGDLCVRLFLHHRHQCLNNSRIAGDRKRQREDSKKYLTTINRYPLTGRVEDHSMSTLSTCCKTSD